MKWYEIIGASAVLIIGLYVVFAPWLSIIEIHKSIDRLTDEIRKWRENEKGGAE